MIELTLLIVNTLALAGRSLLKYLPALDFVLAPYIAATHILGSEATIVIETVLFLFLTCSFPFSETYKIFKILQKHIFVRAGLLFGYGSYLGYYFIFGIIFDFSRAVGRPIASRKRTRLYYSSADLKLEQWETIAWGCLSASIALYACRALLLLFAQRYLTFPSFRGTAPDDTPGVTRSVGALIATPSGQILLAQRGPLTSPEALRMKWSLIGGKCEEGESLEAGLVREVREEVGMDISKDLAIPIGVEKGEGYTFCAFLVLHLGSDQPKVPESEVDKVLSPTWFSFNAPPTTDITAEVLGHIQSGAKYLPSLLAPVASAGREPTSPSSETIWLDRKTHSIPEGFDVVLVNNKDSLCTWYASSFQLPVEAQKTYDEVRANIPAGGYSPAMLYDTTKYPTSIWHTNEKRWIVGSGASTDVVFLLYTQNGPNGHYDALRPSKAGVPIDSVLYPQGRGPTAEARTEGESRDQFPNVKRTGSGAPICPTCGTEGTQTLTYASGLFCAPCHVNVLTGKASISSLFKDLQLEEPENKSSNVATTVSSPSEGLGTKVPTSNTERNTPLPPTPAFSIGAGVYRFASKVGSLVGANSEEAAQVFYSWAASVISAKIDRIATTVTISDRADLVVDLEHEHTPSWAPTSAGLLNFLNFIREDTTEKKTIVKNYAQGGLGLVGIKTDEGPSEFISETPISYLAGPERHRLVLGDNLRPFQVMESTYHASRQLQSMFPVFQQPTIGARCADNVAKYLNTSDDFGADGLAYIYERLVSGAIAATMGARARRPAADTNIDAIPADDCVHHNDLLFPGDAMMAYLLNARVHDAAMPGGGNANTWGETVAQNQRPAPWYNPGVVGLSSCSMLFNFTLHGFDNFPTINPAANGRDFTRALANFHLPYCGLRSPEQFVDAAGVNRATLAPLAPHSQRIPPLVLYSSTRASDALRGVRGQLNADARNRIDTLQNPQSWIDACCFLLQYFGGSDAFAIGAQNAFRRSASFFPAHLRELPLSLEERSTTPGLTACLRRRLVMMRLRTPELRAASVNRNSGRITRIVQLAHAVPVVGPALAVSHRGQAGYEARVQAVFPGLVVNNIPDGWGWPNAAGQVVERGVAADYTWHQMFASVDVTSIEEIEKITKRMTSAEQACLKAWLSYDFATMWALPAADFPIEDFQVRPRYIDNTQVGAGADSLQFYAHYADLPREFVLPATGFVETANVCVPAGLSMLRSMQVSGNLYHTDSLALTLQSDLQAMTGDRLMNRLAVYAMQLRSCADVAAYSEKLCAAKLLTRSKPVMSGHRDLDSRLARSTLHSEHPDQQQTLDSFVDKMQTLTSGVGIASSIFGEAKAHIATLRLPLANTYDYTAGALGNEGTWRSLVCWRSLHPFTVQTFIPGAQTFMPAVNHKVTFFKAMQHGSYLPWNDWVISAAAFLPLEVFSAFRVAMSCVGYNVPVRLVALYQANEFDPTFEPFELPAMFGSLAPRRSDAFPYAPTASVDPLLVMCSQIKVNLVASRADGSPRILEAIPNTSYLTLPRMSFLAPQVPSTHLAVGAPAAPTHNFVSANVEGYTAGANIGFDRPVYIGMQGSIISPLLNGNGRRTEEFENAAVWAAAQQAANEERNRGWVSFINDINDMADRYDYQGKGAGNPVWRARDIIGNRARRGGYEAALRHGTHANAAANRNENSIYTYVPYPAPDPVTAGDNAFARRPMFFFSQLPHLLAFLKNIQFAPKMYLPPIVLGSRFSLEKTPTPSHPFTGMNGVEDVYRATAAGLNLGEALIPMQDENHVRKAVVVRAENELMSAPAETFARDHFRPARLAGSAAFSRLSPIGTSSLGGYVQVAQATAEGRAVGVLDRKDVQTFNEAYQQRRDEKAAEELRAATLADINSEKADLEAKLAKLTALQAAAAPKGQRASVQVPKDSVLSDFY
uniref:Coat protein n=1 Tax=Pterostylis sanguinea virus A TaxID=1964430 RepID=A0A288R5Z2_9VIRU|nr:coat protein [Pterostylis sanguinea virus A]